MLPSEMSERDHELAIRELASSARGSCGCPRCPPRQCYGLSGRTLGPSTCQAGQIALATAPPGMCLAAVQAAAYRASHGVDC